MDLQVYSRFSDEGGLRWYLQWQWLDDVFSCWIFFYAFWLFSLTRVIQIYGDVAVFFFHTVLKSVLVWVHVFVAAWSCTLCRIETKPNTVCVLMAQRNILQSLIHNTCQQDASIVGFSFFLGRDRKPNLATLWFKNVAYFPGDSSHVKTWQETIWLEGLWQMLQIIEF